MAYQKPLLTILILSALGLSTWSLFMNKQAPHPVNHKATTTMDAFMEGVVATFMNQQGKPTLKLVSAKMTHYKEQDVTDIINPKLTVYRPSHEPWLITANYAKANDGIEQILFWDNVVIHHAGDFSSPAMEIKTSSLTVFPKNQTATTAEAITVAQPHMVMRAKGMEGNIKTGIVRLLSQTSGEYVPEY